MSNPVEFKLITTADDLRAVSAGLEIEKAIAVDLEADSMYHFKEKVCLLQIATPRQNLVIDPLRVRDLDPLKPVFANRNIKKILHGADYDVRSLYRDFKIAIHHLFDTQLASRFLGIRETGLEAVLAERFGVKLNKKFQRKDWSKRPLPEDMIAYAANDVRYLLPLAEILEKELTAKGRASWIAEECELLSRVRPAQNNHEPLYLHFKGAGTLKPAGLAVLEALLKYRRSLARKKDKPLFKVFSNTSMLKIAVKKPTTIKQLEENTGLSRKQIQMHGDTLIDVVKNSLEMPAESFPVYPRRRSPAVHPAVPDRVKALKRWRDKKARALDIEPGILLNKQMLMSIAVLNPRKPADLASVEGIKKWQKKEFGKEILYTLQST